MSTIQHPVLNLSPHPLKGQNQSPGPVLISSPLGGGGREEGASLDRGIHKWPETSPPLTVHRWTQRQRRFYHRVISGYETGEELKFLTLTSTPSSLDIHDSFRVFVKRVRRAWGRFEYVAVKEVTRSGLFHLHALFKGPFIPQSWISDVWKEIHGAPIVYIQRWRGDRRKAVGYLSKYLTKAIITRFWYSWGWVYRGFAGAWAGLKRVVEYPRALGIWKDHLRRQSSIYILGGWVLSWGEGLVSTLSLNTVM